VDPYIDYTVTLLHFAAGTGLSLVLAHNLPLKAGTTPSFLVPAALATLFTGFLVLVSRRKALTQVVGYLVLENGIYLFGLLLVEQMPILVETGILLDLFVGVFVMGIVINHIRTAFDSTDTRHLAELKD
jgi:hydrogenase-4 component E